MHWLSARVHPTWHFTALCLGVVVGTAVARETVHLNDIVLLVITVILTVLSFSSARRVMIVTALFAGCTFGLWRGGAHAASLAIYRDLYATTVTLRGRVVRDADKNSRGQIIIQLGDIHKNEMPLPGELRVTLASANYAIQRSDTIIVRGFVERGYGGLGGVMDDATIVSVSREKGGDIARTVRDWFAIQVHTAISSPASDLGVGYLLGQKSALPVDLEESLRIAGLTHIVVASGYNLMVLVRLTRRIFAPISKYLAVLSGGTLVMGFIAITGASPSMTRAGIVAGLGLWAWYYGRKFHPVTLLLFAAAATVLLNPTYAWGDVGWQLSFAAFAGVMIVAPLIRAYFYGNEKPAFVSQLAGEAIAAQIMTAPIIMAVFGQFSNISIIANLLVLPFVPLAMLLVAFAGIGSAIFPAFAAVFGWPAQVVLDAMVAVIEWCASVSWAHAEVALSWWGVVLWYCVLAGALTYVKWRTQYRLYDASIVD